MNPLNEFKICMKDRQSRAFKSLVQMLNNISTTIDITIYNDKMDMLTINSSNSVLIYASFAANKFDSFHVGVDEIKLNINLSELYDALKLKTFNIHGSHNVLIINDHKLSMSNIILNQQFNRAKFEDYVRIPLCKLINICRNISRYDNLVIIEIDNRGIHFISYHDTKKRKSLYNDNKSIETRQYSIFDLEHLIQSFNIKSVCDENVVLYLKRDYPLIIKYTINKFANVFVCLAPLIIEK